MSDNNNNEKQMRSYTCRADVVLFYPVSLCKIEIFGKVHEIISPFVQLVIASDRMQL